MLQFKHNLVRLRPMVETVHVSQGRTVLATGRDGFVTPTAYRGLFVDETRLLSRYRWQINGKTPQSVATSNVDQHSWLGYYIMLAPGIESSQNGDDDVMRKPSEQTLELRLSRYVGGGVHEDVDLTNFTQHQINFSLSLQLDADFADIQETHSTRQQKGTIDRQWRPGKGHGDEDQWELAFSYHAEHAYDHQGNEGVAQLTRGIVGRFRRVSSAPTYENGTVTFAVELLPRETWHACIDWIPKVGGQDEEPRYSCHSFANHDTEFDRKRDLYLSESTDFETAGRDTLAATAASSLEQAKRDLVSLRLYDCDHGKRDWMPAAGLPMFVAIFGRDSLTAAWQSALASPAMMRGVAQELPRWQGTDENDWRDEQPGRMLHEAHRSPLATLQFEPYARYYGSITTSTFYPVMLAELWHWTGDRELVGSLIDSALKGLRWLNERCDRNRNGFFEYQTHSEQGVRHQAWKDSDNAIVDQHGSQISPPIATCEEQGFVYAAKLQLSGLLWWFDRKDEAKQLYREACELKQRFNEAFWLDDEEYFALGLGPDGTPIRSITSNPGHCLATAIADDSRAPKVARRMMSSELFSGWGIRTLSSQNPAYSPYSYHRGSVWPVEQGTFSLGFARYGLHDQVGLLCGAQFEAAEMFNFNRLPEVFSGHPRDDDHPFPAIYPEANFPQAWSASTIFTMVQSMLGVYPYAPLNLLLVDPHLPHWLPELTLRNLRVGESKATIHFYRNSNGTSSYRVLEKHGSLHILRQPSPWSLTTSYAERIKDVLVSMLPGK